MIKNAKSSVDIPKIASLARLELTENEISEFQKDMQAMLNYVALLSELDLGDVKPTSHASPIMNVCRSDIRGETLEKEDVIKNAPEVLNEDYFKVPPVIENEKSEDE